MISSEPPSTSVTQMDAHQLHLAHLRHLAHLYGIRSAHKAGSEVTAYIPRHAKYGGTLSCSGLESLWISAGGNPAHAFTAAEIAEAESGGQQYATGPAGERGYWQIHPDHGALSTYDPYGNAHAAIVLSFDGTNWSAWTTYTSGAYIGKC